MSTDQCPYAKSDMTPCVLKGGPNYFVMNLNKQPICIGCGRRPEVLGVPRPDDWEKRVAEFYADRNKAGPSKRGLRLSTIIADLEKEAAALAKSARKGSPVSSMAEDICDGKIAKAILQIVKRLKTVQSI